MNREKKTKNNREREKERKINYKTENIKQRGEIYAQQGNTGKRKKYRTNTK